MNSLVISRRTSEWLKHPFYRDAVVLGIDVGIEGIGVCLRKGPDVIYNKTIVFDLPEAEALKKRRQLRAARHCRKNRRTRMHRLRKLFAKHGLPWPQTDQLSRTDPYKLRHRAITGNLASREALALVIRHVVLRRGYDFFANSEGEYPWGEDAKLTEAARWLGTSHISDEVAAYLAAIEPQLFTKACPEGKEMTDALRAKDAAERAAFHQSLAERLAACGEQSIATQLETYRRTSDQKVKSAIRGRNIPRGMLEEHLREIISRHSDMILEPDAFAAALFLKPGPAAGKLEQKRAKERAIFHFNRKTKAEIETLWQRKTKDCPLAVGLGLPSAKAGDAGNPAIRRWRILEFAATRRIEATVTRGKGPAKSERKTLVNLPGEAAAYLVSLVDEKQVSFASVRARISGFVATVCEGAKPVADTRSRFNADYFSQLRDLVCPTLANSRRKAGIAPETAASLFDIATAGGTDFSPAALNARLNEIGFYEQRRMMGSDAPLYPQVRLLLGQRPRTGRAGETRAVPGRLQRLFADPAISSAVGGRNAPDFLVIECVGDAPRNLAQKTEFQREQNDRRSQRDKLFDGHPVEDSGVASRRRRIVLHDQQRGLCPFTRLELGDPLSPDLELEHLFPQSRGGLSTDANLVLTFRWVNGLKGNSTPKEFAARRPDPRILNWDGMREVTRDFKWSARKNPDQPHRKRDLFEFDGTDFPDFGNTTFTAQLARQLVKEASVWMGIRSAEEQRKRIATPSGWLAAQARRTWILDQHGQNLAKNRDEPQHHLVDALVLAHIPPAEGMNSVECGGIFWSEWQEVEWRGTRTRRAVTKALPELLPPALLSAHLHPLLGSNPDSLPVEKHRARRKWAGSIGDSTFWRVDFQTGRAYQRTPLKRTDKDFTSAEAVLDRLRLSRIPERLLPSKSQVDRWLHLPEDDATELKLADETPVRSVWKPCGKGNLTSPLGWTAEPDRNGGHPRRFLNLSVKSECLEIWVAWNGKKWVFLKRRAPDKTALRHLLRFAGPWTGQAAPSWMQDKPEKPERYKTLEEIVCGCALPKISRRVATIRKGDEFRVSFTNDGKIRPYAEGLPSTWVTVTAIKGDLTLKFIPLLKLPDALANKKREAYTLGAITELLEITGSQQDAAAAAKGLGLAAPSHDPSLDIGGESRAGAARHPRQADLWDS